MRKIVPVVALCAALTTISGSVRAQDLSALLSQSNATMQDLENGALRNTMNRVSTSIDTASSPGQGNAFYGVQDGQSNRHRPIRLVQPDHPEAGPLTQESGARSNPRGPRGAFRSRQ